jgi:Xaa-Pro aminopeptidase
MSSTILKRSDLPARVVETSPSSNPRYHEIEQKQKLIARFLATRGYDALILHEPWNFQWFTAGGNNVTPEGKCCASLFITADSRVILTSCTDSRWLFDTQVPELGFHLKERTWSDAPDLLPNDLSRGRKVASDTGFGSTKNIEEQLQKLRLTLNPREQLQAMLLGEELARCVERSAIKSKPGQSERDIAGALTHRLMAAGIEPLGVRVIGEGRNAQHRNTWPTDQIIENYLTISATGRQDGICMTVSRSVAFGEPERKLRAAYQAAAFCQATGIVFSQRQTSLGTVWNRVLSMYQKLGYRDEWRRGDQGHVLAHRPCEQPILPDSRFQLETGMMVNWKPQIGTAALSDTVLLLEEGPDWITKTDHWPRLQFDVKGEQIFGPDLVIL